MPKNALTEVRETLSGAMAPELKKALPAHVTPDKFSRVAMTAITQNPELLDADRRSLFASVVKLAQDGLLPDGREAALVTFNVKQGNNWVKSVQAMPMISGVLKKIRNSGEVAKVNAQVVYEKDHFEQELGFEETITHRPPPLGQPRGEPIGVYAVAVLKSGEHLLEVMDINEVEKVRSVSRSGQRGPWAQWWGEMARKTVIRRLSKRLPMSSDVEKFILNDETTQADFEDEAPARLSGDMLRKQAAGQQAIEDKSEDPEPEEEPEEDPAVNDDLDDEIPDFDGPPPHGDEPLEEKPPKDTPKLTKELIEDTCEAEADEDLSPAEEYLDRIYGKVARAKTVKALKTIAEDLQKNKSALTKEQLDAADVAIGNKFKEIG